MIGNRILFHQDFAWVLIQLGEAIFLSRTLKFLNILRVSSRLHWEVMIFCALPASRYGSCLLYGLFYKQNSKFVLFSCLPFYFQSIHLFDICALTLWYMSIIVCIYHFLLMTPIFIFVFISLQKWINRQIIVLNSINIS